MSWILPCREGDDSAAVKGMTAIGLMLDMFKGKLDVKHPDPDSTLVTIRILTASGKRAGQDGGTAQRKGPKPPVIF